MKIDNEYKQAPEQTEQTHLHYSVKGSKVMVFATKLFVFLKLNVSSYNF